MTKVHILLFLGFVAASIGHIQALTDEDIETLKTKYAPIIKECAEKYKSSLDEVIASKTTGKYDDNPCILSCTFKKIGIMSEDGKLNLDETKKVIKPAEAVEACESVNDEQLSGDDVACQRADLLRTCFLKNNVGLA